jgi:hypothetical protein
MAETNEGQPKVADTQPPPAPEPRSQRALRWWLAAGTFVVGLFVGGIVVGLVSGGSTTLPATGSGTGSSSPGAALPTTGAVRTSSAGATAQVVVNEACLRALNAAQDVYGTIGDLADAARQLNAARLDQVIRDLEPLQGRLRQNLSACQVETHLPNGSTTTGTPTGTASPTS